MSGSNDARFEDGVDRPLRLAAEDADDLEVISTLIQDAVFPASEMRWDKKARRFGVLINRFRWEDHDRAQHAERGFERVQSVLAFDDVKAVQSQGIQRGDADMVHALLSVIWEKGQDGSGRIVLTLAGDGAVALEAECLNVTLQDVTRPYLAPSGKAPHHPD